MIATEWELANAIGAVDATQPAEELPSVLIVDDSPLDRMIASRLIAKGARGLTIRTAADGPAALELIEREPVAAVLTDLQMPGLSGLELVRELRERRPEIPVILMTAHGSEDVAIEALHAGASSYVPKQALATALNSTLDRVLAAASVQRGHRRLLACLSLRESSFVLPNDADLIAPLIASIQDDLAGLAFGDQTTRTRIAVALQEALANALYHGNLEVSSDLRDDDEREFYGLANQRRTLKPYRDRRIQVHARLTREQATFVIGDQGPGFDISVLDRPIDPECLLQCHGRGLLLIRTFMDEVRHNSTGNEVTLVKRMVG